MAILPESNIDLFSVDFQAQPSRTWNIDKETNRINGETDGLDAVRQAVEIILNTERFRWQIFQPYSGVQLESLIGENAAYAGAELQKRIREGLLVDDRVTNVTDFETSFTGNTLTASFSVATVYGTFQAEVIVA